MRASNSGEDRTIQAVSAAGKEIKTMKKRIFRFTAGAGDGAGADPGRTGQDEDKVMKKKTFSKAAVCLVLCVLLVFGVMYMNASSSEGLEGIVDWGTLYTYGDITEENTRIEVQTMNEENVLVLPSTASPEAVSLFFDIPDSVEVSVRSGLKSTPIKSGDTVNVASLARNGDYKITLKAQKGRESSKYTIKLSFTDNIGAMYLVSDDAENEGRLWVESSPDKSNKATGSMILQNADGSVVYNDSLTQIKGRGNSTWEKEKKPYQIKLNKKTDLLQTGREDNESKTWVLLANYFDATSVRNTLIYNLGRELGMDFCTENNWVNLYYDGEYRGCYLLSEKVEIGSGRVDVTDLEKLNEEANEDVDIEDLPIEMGKTSNGATYTYCAGMNSPEDVTGGYLLELEFDTRAEEEICHFITTRGRNVVVKSPEYASKEEMDYIASLYQEWEDAVYCGGVNPETGKKYTEYVDLRSAAICYLANEFSKNQDGFKSSSYLYKDSDDDLMYMGPLWDYDVTLNFDGALRPTGLYTAREGLGAALCELGDFREAVKAVYLDEMYPLLTDVILGGEDAVSPNGAIHSISYYDALTSVSVEYNNLLWANTKDLRSEVAQLRNFVSERTEYLKDVISAWSADTEFVLPESLYTDVEKTAWYYEDVYKAAEYGLMTGGGGDVFAPAGKALRAQVIQSMYNAAGNPIVDYIEAFEDVKQNAWYANAVAWGVHNGIIPESSDGMFRPTEEMLREEVVVFLYRYLGSPEVDGDKLNQFADADQVSDHAKKAMEWAIEEDILVIQNKKIRPSDVLTRAELASLLVRFYEKFVIN